MLECFLVHGVVPVGARISSMGASKMPPRCRPWVSPGPGRQRWAASIPYSVGWTRPPSRPLWPGGAGRDCRKGAPLRWTAKPWFTAKVALRLCGKIGACDNGPATAQSVHPIVVRNTSVRHPEPPPCWETRQLRATEALNEYLDWPGVRQVCQVRRRVEQKGSVSMETRYAITSLGRETGPGKLLEY